MQTCVALKHFWRMRARQTTSNMADSGEEGMSASWWGGWLQTAKEKSSAALDLVRKDLMEFGCTMQNDAGHAVQFTSSTLKESLKTENTSAAKEKLTKGLNTLLEGISKALVVPPDDEGQIPITASSAELYDRTKARLHAIQVNPETYLETPSGPTETYGMWCEGFDLDEVKGEISELLVSKSEVRRLYTKLVPSQVSHVDFWRHYFYKLHQVDVDQARKEALMKRADSTRADSLSWEDDWSGDEGAEDSGSDWEKLPRPNQPQPPASTEKRVSPSHKPTPSQQQTDAQVPAREQEPPTEVEVQSGTERLSIEASVLDAEQSQGSKALPSRQPLPDSCTDLSQPVLAASSSSVMEGTGSPTAPCSAENKAGSHVVKEETEAFKDYLKFSPSGLDDAASVETSAQPDATGPSPSSVELVVAGDPETQHQPASAVPVSSDTVPSEMPEGHQAAVASLPEVETGSQASVVPASDPGAAAESVGPAGVAETEEAGAIAADKQLSVAVESECSTLKTTEKGDLVLVGSDHGSPLSNTSGSKGVSDVDDDWEQDLDIELTEEDMKAAEELAKKLGDNIHLEDDDWESWE